MMLVPDINSKSFVFFFEKGTSGLSWSIRDYSIRNRVKEYGPQDFHWTADEVNAKASQSLDAPTVSTNNLAFWHEHTLKCNEQHLGTTQQEVPSVASSLSSVQVRQPITAPGNGKFPVLNFEQLSNSPKGRKVQDMERILHSPNSEDWVTWNFFQSLYRDYPTRWWGHVVNTARRRNANLLFPFDDRSLPKPLFWSSVSAPSAYEVQSRTRMLASGNPQWSARANGLGPVEGSSEIDILFNHDQFVVYAEAKLGSDVSMSTTYDPQRNQIIRNIDCLIESAGDRTPIFWMLVRDERPDRAYVQLMNSYRDDPALLSRDLPHRDPLKLKAVAQNLTILLWMDFSELVFVPGGDSDSTAVKQELERRILGRS
jgi:hypothetical protein